MTRENWLKWMLAFFYLLTGSSIMADERSLDFKPHLNVGIELFRWQEFDVGGIRLLTEQGPRLFFAVGLNKHLSDKNFFYNLEFKGYSGAVDYDGQDNNGIFISSESTYNGWYIDIEGGYRIKKTDSGNAIDVIFGMGLEQWEREIENAINASGNPVSGIVEEYEIPYQKLAIGLLHSQQRWDGYFQLGMKKPISTTEDVDGFGVSLSPGKKWSAFASYKISFKQLENDHHAVTDITLYYDSYQFQRSAQAFSPVFAANVLQPKSNMDVFGLSLGHSF